MYKKDNTSFRFRDAIESKTIHSMINTLSMIYTLDGELLYSFVLIVVKRPGKQFFSHVETEPTIPGYYQYFLGSKCLLLKETTHRPAEDRTRVS